VTRFSMGVQAWQPRLLKTLGRIHSPEQVTRSTETLRKAGVKNLNLDLIFGVPGQERHEWFESLEKTTALSPEHISAYCLTYEEDTEFFRLRTKGKLREDPELDAIFFEATPAWLAEHGYEQYEISNFAKKDRESRHNLAYWQGAAYLGLGPSAWSTRGNRRWRNQPDTRNYVRSWLEKNCPLIDEEEILSKETLHNERVAFGLRLNQGIPHKWIENQEEYTRLKAAGYLREKNRRCSLTPQGRLLADSIAETLLVLP
ncbi:MAG: coproporphyrinogen-III oxidase family protein, partial [Chthoniobacterales bacterium]